MFWCLLFSMSDHTRTHTLVLSFCTALAHTHTQTPTMFSHFPGKPGSTDWAYTMSATKSIVMVCGRHCCGRHGYGLWPPWFVAAIVVAVMVMVCGRHCCGCHGQSAVMVCGRHCWTVTDFQWLNLVPGPQKLSPSIPGQSSFGLWPPKLWSEVLNPETVSATNLT